jgi:DNA-binding PadR family transcriptional regulator
MRPAIGPSANRLTPLLHIDRMLPVRANPPSLSPTERVVLELLAARQDRMYGLELVAESSGHLKRGTVYVLLGRMQKKGYVEAEPEKFADDSGLVPRRMYHATTLGLRVLRAWTIAAESLAWEPGA